MKSLILSMIVILAAGSAFAASIPNAGILTAGAFSGGWLKVSDSEYRISTKIETVAAELDIDSALLLAELACKEKATGNVAPISYELDLLEVSEKSNSVTSGPFAKGAFVSALCILRTSQVN